MRQLAIAQHNHHDTEGSFTPAYTVDASGTRLHGWRSELLPYIEEPNLHAAIDFTKAWDSPANEIPRSVEVDAYVCLGSDQDGLRTTYQAIVGRGFALSGAKPTRFDDITDGTSRTLLFFDADTRYAVPWFAPDDADERIFLNHTPDFPSNHPGVVLVAFADSHVKAISLDCDPTVRRAMLTVGGGEKVEADAF